MSTHETGVIHDIGFRHYTGPRLRRGYLLRSLYTESLRGAYGLGRSAKSKVVPFLMLAALTLPALIITVVAGVTGASRLPLPYTQYAMNLWPAILVFVAAQSPASVSRDLRFHVMPLYLSRPLTRSDYVLAKVAAMWSAVFLLLATPLVVLYAGALLGKLPFWAQTRGVLAALAGAVLLSAVLSVIGLLIASVTPQRGFGVAAVFTTILLLHAVSGTIASLTDQHGQPHLAGWFGLLSPFFLVDGFQVWVLGADPSAPEGPPGSLGGVVFLLVLLAVVAGCSGLLQLRYRKVSAS
jgi:ABC-2 type transport system permease protein